MSNRICVVLGTGGTIAGRSTTPGDDRVYTAAQLGIDALLAHVPLPARSDIVTEQVAQVDSKDMGFAQWQWLAARCAHWLAQPQVGGIVVTHGTDTMEETAYFLHRVLAPAKPVVLTGAMRPADAAEPDGPRNLVDALVVAAEPGASGVLVVFAGAVHGAAAVSKVHSQRLDAFGSGDAGPIAQVANARVRGVSPWPRALPAAGHDARVRVATRWPRVEIVMNHAGADGAIVRALLAHGVDGIVAAGTGNGTLGTELEAALRDAVGQGVAVVVATRCAAGPVLGRGTDGLPVAANASPAKARIDLLLQLLERGGA